MQLWKKVKNWRWYNAVSYALNKTLVEHNAQAHVDLKYGVKPRQVLDLFVPHDPRKDKSLIVFVHGGSWQRGQKDDYIFLAQNLAKEGFYVALLNYQLAPEHQFPIFVNDTVQAINWLQEAKQSQSFGYCANHLILMGHSAGAFNVLSAVYPTPLMDKIENLTGIKSVIGIAGPYSFEHRGDPVASAAFPQDIAPEAVMPNYFVYPNHMRHLLLTAEKDILVEHSNTEKMAKALQKIGNHVWVENIPRTKHISIIATLAKGFDRWYITKQKILQFIDAE